MNIARVWGEAVGEEVIVRALPHRELAFEAGSEPMRRVVPFAGDGRLKD